jgi:phage tail-like protein
MLNTQPSSLLQYLPAIYREEPFLGHFLLAFEKLLFGRDDDVPAAGETKGPLTVAQDLARDRTVDRNLAGAPLALERTIAALANYFDPYRTPDEFLPWLASWTAFSLRADLDSDKQRDFIANVISRYRWRGTKKNLEDLLKIFTIGTPRVEDIAPATCTAGFIHGTTLTVGGIVTGIWSTGQLVSGGTTAAGTYVVKQRHGAVGGAGDYDVSISQNVAAASLAGHYAMHCFSVIVTLPEPTHGEKPELIAEVRQRQFAITRALVEFEKPAHTYCDLQFDFHSMQVGITSHVGLDTLLGTDHA